MFPNNSVALQVGQAAMNDMASVGLFIPDGVHEQAAGTTLEELHLAMANMEEVTVEKVVTFSDLEKFHIVVFPNLDMHPRKSRQEYSTMCKNLFR